MIQLELIVFLLVFAVIFLIIAVAILFDKIDDLKHENNKRKLDVEILEIDVDYLNKIEKLHDERINNKNEGREIILHLLKNFTEQISMLNKEVFKK